MNRYEILVGVAVVDQESYAAYRREMTPLLEACGGGFRFDCEVSRVLRGGGEGAEVNRVFVIGFPSREVKEHFFSDPRYVEIRERLFTKAVARTVRISEYETTGG